MNVTIAENRHSQPQKIEVLPQKSNMEHEAYVEECNLEQIAENNITDVNLIAVDKWMRRRIRAFFWKRWKKIRTKFEKLKYYGIKEHKAWEHANTRKSYWRTANSPILATTLTNSVIREMGYLFFYDYYRKVTDVN